MYRVWAFQELSCLILTESTETTDCSFSITPNEEFSNFEVALTIADRLGTTLLMSPVTVNSRNDAADAVVVYRGSNHPVNGSLCVISNLEVYRGRGQITEIESGGFSLNERGFIQVTMYTKIATPSRNNSSYSFIPYFDSRLTMPAWCTTLKNTLENSTV